MGGAQFTLALHKAWRGSKGQGLFMPEEQRGADRSIPSTERQHCSLTPKEQTCTGRSQRRHGCTTIWSRKSVGQLQAMAREVHVGREGPEQSRVQTLMWPGGCLRPFSARGFARERFRWDCLLPGFLRPTQLSMFNICLPQPLCSPYPPFHEALVAVQSILP